MLEHLSINSLGVIEETTVEFDPGFTAVTGETGAGKTMVITALNLLLGARADAGAIRSGQPRASVEAGFTVAPDHVSVTAVEEAGGVADHEGDTAHLIISRAITASGGSTRSRATAGGASVPVALLGQLGEHSVAVHGQSDQLRLKSPAAQRHAVDSFGGQQLAGILEDYQQKYRRLNTVREQIHELTTQAQERAREAENLQRSLTEIDEAQPTPGEEEELHAHIRRLENVESLREAAGEAHVHLSGSDYDLNAASAESLVEAARQAVLQAPGDEPELLEAAKRLAETGIQLADISAELSAFSSSLDDEGPHALNAAQSRLAELNRLMKLYGPEISDVLEWAETHRGRLDELQSDTDMIEQLEDEQEELTGVVQDLGQQLTSIRTQTAQLLSEKVTEELHGLLMPTAQFLVSIEPLEEPGPFGLDDIALLLQPHPGSDPRPLGKGASGGELSRIMLALEVVLADTDPVPTFVFDEIDSGVGGEAAVQIGQRLARLAEKVQVIVVTHLPQVAAYADRHVRVNKSPDVEAGFTTSDILVLEGEDRISELARMLAGHADSESARAHARELIDRSAAGPKVSA